MFLFLSITFSGISLSSFVITAGVPTGVPVVIPRCYHQENALVSKWVQVLIYPFWFCSYGQISVQNGFYHRTSDVAGSATFIWWLSQSITSGITKWWTNVSVLDPFFRLLNTIISTILNTNRSDCRFYILYFILFHYLYNPTILYLLIIYLPRVLLLLPFDICASCKFDGMPERGCKRRCQNR